MSVGKTISYFENSRGYRAIFLYECFALSLNENLSFEIKAHFKLYNLIHTKLKIRNFIFLEGLWEKTQEQFYFNFSDYHGAL
jgi:hypothetical protein